MNENKSRDIFYGIIAVATLIVALIGATLAYFSISSSSNEGAVNAKAKIVSIEYKDGQNVVAQAEKLIPATLEVVKSVYDTNKEAINAQASAGELAASNACIDSNRQEVCSIYRFSVKSDVSRNITALLKSENNEFEYLAYAVKDVTNDTWLKLDSGNNEFIALAKCNVDDPEPSKNCYNIDPENGQKDYVPRAINSIFGYNETNDSIEKNVSDTEQVYDLILFIKENRADQNVDQGKQFHGTITVNVNSDDSEGQITGEYRP